MGSFQGKRVSDEWGIVLEAAWEDGVRFQPNSGQRTMEEQWALYRKYQAGTGNLAAYPSENAPHIRKGKKAHALDIDSFAHNDGENRLQRWLVKQGVNPTNPIRGESWHLEILEAELARLVAKFRDKFKGYTPSESRWIKEYDGLVRSGKDKDRRAVLRRVMKEQRQRIWTEAKQSGWGKASRRKRYASLRARS